MAAKKAVKEGKTRASDEIALRKLKSKINNFEELKREFDLSEEDRSSRAILKKIIDHLETYEKIIIQVFQPEEFHSLYESNYFSDTEKSELFELYKRIMINHREVMKSIIENDESNNIATINFVSSEIKSMKPGLVKLAGKLKDSWKNDSKKGNIGYFG